MRGDAREIERGYEMYLIYQDLWSEEFNKALEDRLKDAGEDFTHLMADPSAFSVKRSPFCHGFDIERMSAYDQHMTGPQFEAFYGPTPGILKPEHLGRFFSFLEHRLMLAMRQPIKALLIFSPITAGREFVAARCRDLGIPVIAFGVGPFPGSLMIERDDTEHRSRLGFSQFFRHLINRVPDPDAVMAADSFLESWKDSKASRGPLGATVSGGAEAVPIDAVLVIGQSPTDANQIIHQASLEYNPVIICRWLRDMEAGPVVFKPHPEDETAVEVFHDAGTQVVKNCNIHDAIKNSSSIVTWNSNVGIEAMTYGKPVACLGQAYYRHPELVNVVNSREDLEKFISCETTHVRSVRERFLVYLISRFLAWENRAGHVVRRIESEVKNASV
jgi:hypothetical protein